MRFVLAALAALLPAVALAQALPQPQVITQPVNDNSNRAASTGYVDRATQGLGSGIATNTSAILAEQVRAKAVEGGLLPRSGGALTGPISLVSGSTGDVSAMSATANGSTQSLGAVLGTVQNNTVAITMEAARAKAVEALMAQLASPSFTGQPSMPSLALTGPGSTGDASVMSAKPSGAGAIGRALQDIVGDTVTPATFRSVVDADDSMSFMRAVAAKRLVVCAAGKEYVVGGVDLSNSQVVDCRSGVLRAATGSSYMFRLLDYASELRNAYIADASGTTTAIVIGSSYNARLRNATIINAQNAIALVNSAGQSSTQVSRPVIENVLVDHFTGIGLSYGPNVAELNATRLYLDAGTVASSTAGKQKPRPGTYGVKGVSTGTTLAAGGTSSPA